MLSLEPRPFVHSFYDIGMRPNSLTHSYLTTVSALFWFCFVIFCFFGDATFPESFVTFIAVFSLYREYVVRFSLPGSVFLPYDRG